MTPLEYAETICYSSKQVLRFTHEMSVKYRNHEGIYLEAGTAAGAQVIALLHGAPNKEVYALDSFMGLPRPSNKDDQFPGIRFISKEEQQSLPNPGEQVLESTGAVSVSVPDFLNNINTSGVDSKNLTIVAGWFEEVLPKFYCPPIAILRLDSDLYNSTYVCLKYLYPKLIIGGLCIIDDYALPGCRQAVFDYFFDNRDELNSFDMEFIEDKNSKVAYWIKK